MATFEDYLASLPEVIECPGCGQRMNRAGVEPLRPTENREPFWCVKCSGTNPASKGTCPLVDATPPLRVSTALAFLEGKGFAAEAVRLRHLIEAIQAAHELGHGKGVSWDSTPDVIIEQLRDMYNELADAVDVAWTLAGSPCEVEP